MKVRLKFQKYGAMKFIGHLDIMRYFQKAFRRAGYDSEYTKGFNPHQIMSFAAPLGVGLTSDAEYVDIGLNSSEEPEIMIKRINQVMSEGIYVTGFHVLSEPNENEKKITAMSLVASADYLVSLKDGYSLGDIRDGNITIDKFNEAIEGFFSRDDITVQKKTKKSEMDVNIRPMITILSNDEMKYKEDLRNILLDVSMSDYKPSYFLETDSKAQVYENKVKLYMQLDTGSASNLKPELVMEAFCNENGILYNPFAWQVHRLEIYSRDDTSKRLISLDRLER